MTGPEHYWTAEKHLASARNTDKAQSFEAMQAMVAHAQVHATLALAAATAAAGGLDGGAGQPLTREANAWWIAIWERES